MKMYFLFVVVFLMVACEVPKSAHSISKGEVKKVYVALDSGHKFIAYVVERGGVEIIVTDPISESSYKVGEEIQYIDQKIDLGSRQRVMIFTLLDK